MPEVWRKGKLVLWSGSSCCVGGVVVAIAFVVDDAGSAGGACAACVGVGYGVGASAVASDGASLAIASMPLLLGRRGEKGL